jgi:hypothetical protein
MKTSILTITALCSCFSCSHCDGGIITFVGSTGRLDYAFPQGATGFSRTSTDTRNVNVLLPRFDASLGTLQSATISYSSVASGSVLGRLRTARSFPTGVNANLQVSYTLTPPGSGTPVSLVIPASELNESITIPSGIRNFNIDLFSSPEYHSSTISMPSTYLAAMTGTGNITAPFSMQFRQEITTSGGTIDYIFSASTTTNFSLTYTYAEPVAVPEPGGVLFLSLATALVAVHSRKLSGLL